MPIEPAPNTVMFEDVRSQLAVLLAATGLATAIACVDIAQRLGELGSADTCCRVQSIHVKSQDVSGPVALRIYID